MSAVSMASHRLVPCACVSINVCLLLEHSFTILLSCLHCVFDVRRRGNVVDFIKLHITSSCRLIVCVIMQHVNNGQLLWFVFYLSKWLKCSTSLWCFLFYHYDGILFKIRIRDASKRVAINRNWKMKALIAERGLHVSNSVTTLASCHNHNLR